MPSQVPEHIRQAVDARLTALERSHDVRILFAVESGSRAWGFPSPDSDYDIRFVYAHARDWYLSIAPGRDVIELPIEDDLDINGWDIRKALGLLIKPNPTLLEWLDSPIRYRWSSEVCDAFRELAASTAFAKACTHHHRRMAEREWLRICAGPGPAPLKSYFYALRPALTLHWMAHYPDALPPMALDKLLGAPGLDGGLCTAIDALVAQKAKAKELGSGERIPEIDRFIEATLVRKEPARSGAPSPDLLARADTLFRSVIL